MVRRGGRAFEPGCHLPGGVDYALIPERREETGGLLRRRLTLLRVDLGTRYPRRGRALRVRMDLIEDIGHLLHLPAVLLSERGSLRRVFAGGFVELLGGSLIDHFAAALRKSSGIRCG